MFTMPCVFRWCDVMTSSQSARYALTWSKWNEITNKKKPIDYANLRNKWKVQWKKYVKKLISHPSSPSLQISVRMDKNDIQWWTSDDGGGLFIWGENETTDPLVILYISMDDYLYRKLFVWCPDEAWSLVNNTRTMLINMMNCTWRKKYYWVTSEW